MNEWTECTEHSANSSIADHSDAMFFLHKILADTTKLMGSGYWWINQDRFFLQQVLIIVVDIWNNCSMQIGIFGPIKKIYI